MIKRMGMAAVLVLSFALLVLGPAGDRVMASDAGAAKAAAVEQQPDSRTLHCIREAFARFQRCTRQGGSTNECLNRAAQQFNECMGGGGGEQPPRD